MASFIVDVKEILDASGSVIDVLGDFELPELTVGDEVFTLSEPASVCVVIANAGSGIVASGTVSASVRATCSRCLCDFPTTISAEVDGFYIQSSSKGVQEEDSERVLADGTIDLAPALLAGLILEAPFAPIHDPACAGLCTECGADLNTESCTCGDRVDPTHPFASLGRLLETEDEPQSD